MYGADLMDRDAQRATTRPQAQSPKQRQLLDIPTGELGRVAWSKAIHRCIELDAANDPGDRQRLRVETAQRSTQILEKQLGIIAQQFGASAARLAGAILEAALDEILRPSPVVDE